jgi:hypothetical protein
MTPTPSRPSDATCPTRSCPPTWSSPSRLPHEIRTVTPLEHAQFHRQGFLTIPDFVPPSAMAEVRTLLDGLYRLRGREHGSIDNPLHLAPALRRSVVFRTALTVAKQLLGITTMYACDCALYKEPHGRHGTPWHQDRAFHGKFFPNITLAFWIPLQEVTAENGCLHYIPTRPVQQLLPHRPYYPNDYRSMMTDPVDVEQAVMCPVPMGGATIHGPLTLHYAQPNQTGSIRRTWLLTFRPWGRWGFLAPSRLRAQAAVLRQEVTRYWLP